MIIVSYLARLPVTLVVASALCALVLSAPECLSERPSARLFCSEARFLNTPPIEAVSGFFATEDEPAHPIRAVTALTLEVAGAVMLAAVWLAFGHTADRIWARSWVALSNRFPRLDFLQRAPVGGLAVRVARRLPLTLLLTPLIWRFGYSAILWSLLLWRHRLDALLAVFALPFEISVSDILADLADLADLARPAALAALVGVAVTISLAMELLVTRADTRRMRRNEAGEVTANRK